MITGADAITVMRKLDDIIGELRNLPMYESEWYTDDIEDDDEDDSGDGICANQNAEELAIVLEAWRDEIIKAGGIKPLQSYTELLPEGATL